MRQAASGWLYCVKLAVFFAAICIFSRKADPAATVVDADTMHRALAIYEQISKPRAEKALARWAAEPAPTRH
jgi:hypothetical protein